MQAQEHADSAPVSLTSTSEPERTLALPDSRHEAFAQAIALGEDPIATSKRIFRCKTTATAQAKSTTLLADPSIAARITTLQREACHIATQHAHFGKADLIAFLVETIQTPVSTVDQHHRQCQEWTRDELTTSGRRANTGPQQKTQSPSGEPLASGRSRSKSTRTQPPTTAKENGAGEGSDSSASTSESSPPPILLRSKTKLPSKLDAAKLLATLCGWHAPSKLESNVHLGTSPTVEEALSRLLR